MKLQEIVVKTNEVLKDTFCLLCLLKDKEGNSHCYVNLYKNSYSDLSDLTDFIMLLEEIKVLKEEEIALLDKFDKIKLYLDIDESITKFVNYELYYTDEDSNFYKFSLGFKKKTK